MKREIKFLHNQKVQILGKSERRKESFEILKTNVAENSRTVKSLQKENEMLLAKLEKSVELLDIYRKTVIRLQIEIRNFMTV